MGGPQASTKFSFRKLPADCLNLPADCSIPPPRDQPAALVRCETEAGMETPPDTTTAGFPDGKRGAYGDLGAFPSSDSTCAASRGSLPRLIFRAERRLRLLERSGATIALARRALVLEREASEPSLVATVSIDQVDTADPATTIEDVVIIVPPVARYPGDVGAAKDQGRIGHCRPMLGAIGRRE